MLSLLQAAYAADCLVHTAHIPAHSPPLHLPHGSHPQLPQTCHLTQLHWQRRRDLRCCCRAGWEALQHSSCCVAFPSLQRTNWPASAQNEVAVAVGVTACSDTATATGEWMQVCIMTAWSCSLQLHSLPDPSKAYHTWHPGGVCASALNQHCPAPLLLACCHICCCCRTWPWACWMLTALHHAVPSSKCPTCCTRGCALRVRRVQLCKMVMAVCPLPGAQELDDPKLSRKSNIKAVCECRSRRQCNEVQVNN